jgi:hypothetical protein
MPNPKYQKIMDDLGFIAAIGVTPCQRNRHAVRDKHGHCLQCDVKTLVYAARYHAEASVYIAYSGAKTLVKIGLAGIAKDRVLSLNSYSYGGATDWVLFRQWKRENVGRVENDAHKILQDFQVAGTYLKNGSNILCQEIFNCTVDQAVMAVTNAIDGITTKIMKPTEVSLSAQDNARIEALKIENQPHNLSFGMRNALKNIFEANKELISLNTPDRLSLIKEQQRLSRLLDMDPIGLVLANKNTNEETKPSRQNVSGQETKNKASQRRVPILSPMEEQVLSQVIHWVDDYASAKTAGDKLAYLKMPTTKMCSEYFRYVHGDMLDLLNRLEKQELIHKRRRQSAGLSGSGYDGSLHSEVSPTEWGCEVLSRNR